VDALLRNTNSADLLRGLRQAAREKNSRHLERLLEILRTDSLPNIRDHAAIALGALRDLRAKAGLLSALEDPDWTVRSHAGWGLVYLGEPVREDVSRILRTSKNPEAREMARLVLEKLQP
jgi:HEAT repeat protein